MTRHPDALILGALLFALLAGGFASLHHYGVTWDEALGDLFFGERYLSYFTSFDAKYLDFENRAYPPDHAPDLFDSAFRGLPWEYYPAANVMAAATSAVLSRGLHLLDPFDGYHAVNLLLAAVLLAALYRFMRRRWGRGAALFAVVVLFTSPRVAGDLLANIKDFPEMVFFALTLMAFHRALERGSIRGLFGAGALWGLAMGTKANAIFLPAIPVVTLLIGGIPAAWRGVPRRSKAAAAGILAAWSAAALALGFLVFFALWPWLWADPVARLGKNLLYVTARGGWMKPESVAPPLAMVIYTTPIPFLAFFLVGLIPAARAALRRDRDLLFLLIWIAVVWGRCIAPGAVNFDGVRHFLELFPPMAMVAGVGAAWMARGAAGGVRALLARRGMTRNPATNPACSRLALAPAAVLLVYLLPLASSSASLARVHPFEIAYWNAVAGGLRGAREKRLAEAGDYWAVSYRTGLDWLDEHAPQGSLLAVPIAEHVVALTAQTWLRPDIELARITVPTSERVPAEYIVRLAEAACDRPVYVMFVLREDWMNDLTRLCVRRLKPEVEWDTGGAPVLAIYRLPAAQTVAPPPAAP